jgi:hypothetical protein
MERRIRVGMRQIDMYSYVLVKQKKDRRGNGMKEHASCRIEDVISQKEGGAFIPADGIPSRRSNQQQGVISPHEMRVSTNLVIRFMSTNN